MHHQGRHLLKKRVVRSFGQFLSTVTPYEADAAAPALVELGKKVLTRKARQKVRNLGVRCRMWHVFHD